MLRATPGHSSGRRLERQGGGPTVVVSAIIVTALIVTALIVTALIVTAIIVTASIITAITAGDSAHQRHRK